MMAKPVRAPTAPLSFAVLAAILSLAPTPPAQAAAARRAHGPAATKTSFDVFEATIPQIQAALADGRVTSRQLVEAYLARIAAYDQQGPRLNAVVRLNPRALAEADALDSERRLKGARGPLHGVPLLVKDNYDTAEMATSGGTLALATLRPSEDAFVIKRLRAAGAIILGKTAMHELASGVTTVSSLTGVSRNPYDPARSPGGSSGGTGAATAANFAAAGMGSDTCGSIRIPAAYQNLFGLRGTRGLSSRSGIIPLSSTQDIGGPLARSVTDLAILLDATVGPDPADPGTKAAAGRVPSSYRDALDPNGLKGARIGVLRDLFGSAPEDREGLAVAEKAFAGMRAAGAEVVDVKLAGLSELVKDSSVITYEFKPELARYLAGQPTAAVKSLHEVVALGLDDQEVDSRLRLRDGPAVSDAAAYAQALAKQRAAHDLVVQAMAAQHLDALVYPTSLRPPPRIDGDEAGGGASCQLSASTGLPVVAVPAGFTAAEQPIGLELLGRDFTEPTLLRLAYGWEQTAHPRRAPFSTPPLVAGLAPPAAGWRVTTTRPGAGAVAEVQFRYDPTTARLGYQGVVRGAKAAQVTAVTLQRTRDGGPGPVIAQLVPMGRAAAQGELTLNARERSDLAGGRLVVRLYTELQPLGAGEAKVPAYRPPSK
jgi:Asp-tRNA(Asn)/Glu-tRNA(Gln) amidotransferase A subunit family amidase